MDMQLTQVPLRALSSSTHGELVVLDNVRALAAENGFARDWRGLAALATLTNATSVIAESTSPTKKLLQLWSARPLQQANLQLLVDYLEQIDRFDVLEDVTRLLEYDATTYLNNNHEVKTNIMETCEVVLDEPLTMQDVQYNTRQIYDAFVLYADEDHEFAHDVIDRMEKYGLTMCEKEDLLAGSFQHSAILQLISERCNKLVLILSPDFFNSPANTFFINFAQALGIEQKIRKILPCVYKRCIIPFQLSYYFSLDYNRAQKWNFWEKLRDSITMPLHSHTGTSRQIVSERVNLAIKSSPSSVPQIKEYDPTKHDKISCPVPQNNPNMLQVSQQRKEVVSSSMNNLDDLKHKNCESEMMTASTNRLCMAETSAIDDLLNLPNVPTNSIVYSNSLSDIYPKPKLKKKKTKLFPKIKKFFEKPLKA